MDLSVVIPVYNVEKFLADCLEPLTKLTHLKMEVIVVDDGTPDQSMKVAERFSFHLPLKIITQTNRGLSGARNSGLKAATGKYIYFYDSDDVIIPQEFEKLLIVAMKNKLEITMGEGKSFTEDGVLKPIKEIKTLQKLGITKGERFFFGMNKNKEYSPMAWLRIYEHEFLKKNNLAFTEGIIHEDEDFTPRALAVATRCAFYPYDFYRYRYREGSISKGSQHKYLNPKSVPSFTQTIKQMSAVGSSSEVYPMTISKLFLEILRRLEQQKKSKLIERIPEWKDVGLEEEFKKLPFKYKIPIHRYKIKLSLQR